MTRRACSGVGSSFSRVVGLARAAAVAASLIGVCGVALPAGAQQFAPVRDNATSRVWTLVDRHAPAVEAAQPWIRPALGKALVLNTAGMSAVLFAAPREGTPAAGNPMVLLLPDPNGNFQAFSVLESPIMEPGLAAQFPEIRTIVGQGIDDPTATLRADITMQGFHAQVLSANGSWYIDPFSRDDTVHYTSYFKTELKARHAWACEGPEIVAGVDLGGDGAPIGSDWLSSGTQLRTYRLANAATGEYTAFHGGTVALGQSAIVTAINRVTGVYERDLAIRLTLVANNSSIVYTNAATDPYTNNNGVTLLTENQNNITTVIGSANYDIGHVFSTGGGGIAGLGVVCSAGSKARGVTGSGSPVNDPFTIDYVAHEMGHQFGANHTFNGTQGSCGGNRSAANAYEPGSASTIMGYAGICGSDDLQPNSDAYFHGASYEAIRTFITSGGGSTCGTNTNTGNSVPTVAGPGNFTIPSRTPFFLTATGNDPNADALTYCWEERALGPAAVLGAADDGAIPLVRSINPSTSPTRFVPPLANVLNNTTDPEQRLPVLSRTWPWQVTIRDNRLNGGGVNQANITLTVAGGAGPFTVTAPNGSTSWSAQSLRTISWAVANTNIAPVNCANVAIELSTDGGLTFPITVAASVPNTGSANVIIPNNQTNNGRIRVRGVNNIFYNISQGTLTITAPVNGVALSGSGANTFTDNTGNGNNNGRIDPGETSIRLTVPVVNGGTIAATSVTGTLVSNTPTVTVTTNSSTYPNLPATGGTGSNNTAYVISVSPSHVCGAPINLTLNINSAQGTGTYPFSLATGLPGGVSGPQTFTYSGVAVAIPDNNTVGANATINVSGLTGTIADVNFSITGTACSATPGSTTVGIVHTWVGDLRGRLTSPAATQIDLFNQPGGANNNGDNMCNTVLDEQGTNSIQSITAAGNPYSATFIPSGSLSAFNGQNPNGTWTFNIADVAAQDTGTLRFFSITIRTNLPATCTPPVSNVCPTITQNPSSATRCPGQSVSFSALATGTPAPTYQWRRNGININTTLNPSAATATLNLTNVQASDSANYDCVASNACGNATSTVATLTVQQVCCDSLDFNNDGSSFDPQDIEALLSVFSEGPCIPDTATCNDIDFNNDGSLFDPCDINSYLTLYAEGPCTLCGV